MSGVTIIDIWFITSPYNYSWSNTGRSLCVCNWYPGCVVWPNYEVVDFQTCSGTARALYSVIIQMCYFLPLLVFPFPLILSLTLLSPLRPTPIRPPLPNVSPGVTCPPWVPLSGVFSSVVVGVSSEVPFLYHSLISLSSPRCPLQSSSPPRSTPDPLAPNYPSISPPRRISL